MQNIIENKFIRLTSTSIGGEFLSIINKSNNLEYLWQANPAVWGRRSPLLFPNAGKVCDDKIIINSKEYPAQKHGLVRDLEFTVLSESANSISYRLKDNPETNKFFPYAFILDLVYRLEDNIIHCDYIINNTNSVPMPFGIGGHPAFCCPIEPQAEAYTDYEIAFEAPCEATELLCEDGLLSGETRKAFPKMQAISLVKGLFDNDSFLLDGLDSKSVTLRSRKTKHAIKINRKNLPYFLIWSVPGDIPFVCLEPWQGLPDSKNSNHDFLTKRGNLILDPGEIYTCGYSLEIK